MKILLPLRLLRAPCLVYTAKQKDVAYLDVFTPMLGTDGQPYSKWFIEDGLHMNRSGYALWIGIIKPWVDAHGH
jgi:lysophospholipase L1-like esterase